MTKIRIGYRFLQYYFIVGIIILAGFWVFYTQYLIKQLEKETQVRSRIYAQYMRRATEPAEQSSAELDIIFEEVIQKIDFPVIITNADGEPFSYKNLGEVNPSQERLKRLIQRLDADHAPIPLTITVNDTIKKLGEIHYGMSSSAKALRIYPFFQLGFLIIFIVLGIWAIIIYHKREQEQIWNTLAKETAHQLATPLSSFSGWLETLKNKELNKQSNEIVFEMEKDLERMWEVLERFSRIGMPAELKNHTIKEIIENSVEFIKRRASRNIEFVIDIDYNPAVKIDDVLFAWTIENLLKNSVDAIGTNPGKIEITTKKTENNQFLEIDIIDSGEGIKPGKAKDIFKTGVTTKKYGWGVGLTLAKRIIEEYHNGKLFLKSSMPGKTIFTILLKL
ncbi:MAG: HAMP domain-containing sensor histidine kinase [candidate division WOR-3 bacterium]